MVEKSPIKTKPVTAKNALGASFLALRELMQVDEMLQNKNNLALNLHLLGIRSLLSVSTLLKPIEEVNVNNHYYPKEVEAKVRFKYTNSRTYIANFFHINEGQR